MLWWRRYFEGPKCFSLTGLLTCEYSREELHSVFAILFVVCYHIVAIKFSFCCLILGIYSKQTYIAHGIVLICASVCVDTSSR